MALSVKARIFTLVQRELQEYKLSMVITPLAIAGVLTVLMLGSVLLANRITAMGDTFMDLILSDSNIGPVITINIEDSVDDLVDPPAPPSPMSIEVVPDAPGQNVEDDWNFSREWRFEPDKRKDRAVEFESEEVGSLNPVLNVIHGFMLRVLIIVSVNYLLGCLFDDRKDRSFLFWRSMPVSEWEEVLSKLAVALIVAPIIFIAVSILMQLAYVLLAMLLVWRMDMDPVRLVLGNIEFGTLLFNQLSGWVLTALLVAPLYAWLLLASAGAKRSAAFLAVAPPVGLILLEEFFLGTEMVRTAIGNHFPHATENSAIGFYIAGPDWGSVNYLSLVLGLVFTGLALWGAVYLRRYRWEI